MWVYFVLFLIVFCEMGFVVFLFLFGDLLLFIGGVFVVMGEMNVGLLIVLLFVVVIFGNMVNYMIGCWIGLKVFNMYILVFECFFDCVVL